LVIVNGLESSSDDDSTRRRGARDDADGGTMGEKLPGARVGVPVPCDMVVEL
jgi:hypothetical protein